MHLMYICLVDHARKIPVEPIKNKSTVHRQDEGGGNDWWLCVRLCSQYSTGLKRCRTFRIFGITTAALPVFSVSKNCVR